VCSRSLLALTTTLVAAQANLADLFVEPSARASAAKAIRDLTESSSSSSSSSSSIQGEIQCCVLLFLCPQTVLTKKKKNCREKKNPILATLKNRHAQHIDDQDNECFRGFQIGAVYHYDWNTALNARKVAIHRVSWSSRLTSN
jgi:hypothetical protein